VGVKIADVSIFTLPIPVMGRLVFMSEFYFSIVPRLPPQIKGKIYFIFVDFFVDIVYKIDYTLIMVVGQTAINYLRGHKMDDLSVIVFACLVLYALIFAKGPNDE